MSIDYKDTRELERTVEALARDFAPWLKRWMNRQAKNLMQQIIEGTPVDTGRLRDGWRYKISYDGEGDITLEIDNDVYYAVYVEYGHAIPYHAGIGYPGSWDWVDGYFMMSRPLFRFYANLGPKFDADFEAYCRKKGVM